MLLVYALPLAGIACRLGAPGLKRRFSPRVRPSYDYLLGEAFWYAAGYGLLSAGAALLFR